MRRDGFGDPGLLGQWPGRTLGRAGGDRVIVHCGWEVTSEVVRHLMNGVDPDILDTAEAAAFGLRTIQPRPRPGPIGRGMPDRRSRRFRPARHQIDDGEGMRQNVIQAVLDAVPQTRAVLCIPGLRPRRARLTVPVPGDRPDPADRSENQVLATERPFA